MGEGDGGDGQEPKFMELNAPAYYGPVALPLEGAAEVLGVPIGLVADAARRVTPYRHANGSPRWSLMLLERELGHERPKEAGSSWRSAYSHKRRRARAGE